MICKGKNLLQKAFYALIILVGVLVAANCYSYVEILNIRYWTAPDHTRVVLDVDNEPNYEVKQKDNILILNFRDTSFHKLIPGEIILNKPGIKKLVFHNIDKDKVKIEFILDKYRKTEVFKLKKFQDKPDRVVVDVMLQQAVEEETVKEQLPAVKWKKIVVIDPGHGGEDPGAVSKKGAYEKNIVLLISREIKKAINQIPGYRAMLTRDGDYYVSFNKRLQIAKNLGADLFISVHADAAKNRKAKGSSVYCLSTGAASNEAAKLLANNENLSDIIGGIQSNEGNNESDQIILNMFQTNTINLSKTYASMLMDHLDKINCLKHKNVQEAPFRVLKLPDIPAVLIETAYISNFQEERLLKDHSFQKRFASAVASSVKEYLSGTAALASNNDAVKKGNGINDAVDEQVEKDVKVNEVKTKIYKVRKGDTLFSIARNFNTKVSVLLKLNSLKRRDTLFVGRKILVPLSKMGDNGFTAAGQNDEYHNWKKTKRIYTIKKGDTFFSLAKNNYTTVKELCRINNMKSTDPLLYGQKIRLP